MTHYNAPSASLEDYIPGSTLGSLVSLLLQDSIAIEYSQGQVHFRERMETEESKPVRMLVAVCGVEKPNGRAYLTLEPANSYGREFHLPVDYVKDARVLVP